MGYPMTWTRAINREGINPNSANWVHDIEDLTEKQKAVEYKKRCIAADLKRFVEDCKDDNHGAYLAALAGVDLETWQNCMDVLFCHDNSSWSSGSQYEISKEKRQRWRDIGKLHQRKK